MSESIVASQAPKPTLEHLLLNLRVDDGSELAPFLRFVRHLPGSWWVKDASGRYLYLNAAAGESIGRAIEDIVGKTDLEVLPRATAEVLREHDAQVLATGEPLEVLEHVQGADGATRTWFSAKFLLPQRGGACTAGFAIDITKVAQATRDAEGTLQQVLDAITDMVLVKGPHSRLLWANQAFLTTYGMTNEQLRGLIDAPFIEPDVTEQYVKDDSHVFTTGLTLEIPEEPMARYDGRVLTCHTVKSPIFDDQGRVIKTVAVIRDITERKRLELELAQAQKLESVGRLASGIAHEINTPIQFVADQSHFLRPAFADMVALCQKYRAFVDKAQQNSVRAQDIAAMHEAEEAIDLDYMLKNVPAALDSIAEGTTRVANIVRAMKEFGHPDRAEKRNTDLNRALQNTTVIAANELKHVAALHMDLGELPEVFCHAGDLNQVFLNLIVNAAHAIADVVSGTDRLGRITITTRHEHDEVIVSVADTGAGIPHALRSKIFEPFFTTKEIGRGTGQGLAIARMIVVEKHQGSLTFETETGVGTTFTLRIPAPKQTADPTD